MLLLRARVILNTCSRNLFILFSDQPKPSTQAQLEASILGAKPPLKADLVPPPHGFMAKTAPLPQEIVAGILQPLVATLPQGPVTSMTLLPLEMAYMAPLSHQTISFSFVVSSSHGLAAANTNLPQGSNDGTIAQDYLNVAMSLDLVLEQIHLFLHLSSFLMDALSYATSEILTHMHLGLTQIFSFDIRSQMDRSLKVHIEAGQPKQLGWSTPQVDPFGSRPWPWITEQKGKNT